MGKTIHSKQHLTPQQVYSKLYRIAEHILRENNPCQIEKAADGSVSCRNTRKPNRTDVGLCCGGCRNLSKTGCTTDSLWCKTWTCFTLQEETPEVAYALRMIETVARNALVPMYVRTGKDESFARLC